MKTMKTNIAMTYAPMGNGYDAAPDYGDSSGTGVF